MATIAHGPGSVAAGKVRASDSVLASARERAARYVLAALRLSLGWVFLWAFLDKLFGLGHETGSKAAWIHGGSPTEAFLKFGTKGAFSGFYHAIAGTAWADWLFMGGLAGSGLALTTGIGMRVAAATGALLLLMMWSVVLPPANNVFMDDHVVYAGLLVVLALLGAENTWGLGRWWGNTKLVSDYPWLK